MPEETLTAWRKDELSTSVLVDHREAKGRIDITDHDHTLEQLRGVYGEASEWMDLERLYREMIDPRSCPDDATAARYFLNRSMATVDAWIASRNLVVDRVEQLLAELRAQPAVDLAMLAVANRQLRGLIAG